MLQSITNDLPIPLTQRIVIVQAIKRQFPKVSEATEVVPVESMNAFFGNDGSRAMEAMPLYYRRIPFPFNVASMIKNRIMGRKPKRPGFVRVAEYHQCKAKSLRFPDGLVITVGYNAQEDKLFYIWEEQK